MQNREYAAQYFVALRFSCSRTSCTLPAKSLARLVLLASCSVLLLSIQTRGGCVAIRCQAVETFGYVRLSTLPRVILAFLVLLASPSFLPQVATYKGASLSQKRNLPSSHVLPCTLLSGKTTCFVQICNPSP